MEAESETNEQTVDEENPNALGIFDFLRTVINWLRPYPGRCALIALCLLLEMGFTSGVPLVFQAMIDKAIVPHQVGTLFMLLALLAAGAVVVSIAGVGRDYFFARIVTKVLNDLRSRMFELFERLSADYFSRRSASDVTARFSSDTASVEHGLTSIIGWLVLPGLDVLVGTFLLFMLDWRLALVAQLVWPLSLAGPQWFTPRASRAVLDLKTGQDRMLSTVEEAARGQPVIKAFGLNKFIANRFQKLIDELTARGIRMYFILSVVERSSGIGIMLLQAVVLGAGGYLAFRGRLTIGSLVAFQSLFTGISYSIGYITQFVPTLIQSAAGLERIQAFFAEAAENPESEGAKPLPSFSKEISIENVHFTIADKKILSDVSLKIQQGESVAFVGPSGSGKSSLMSLLLRFHEPSSGTVKLDGHDIGKATRESLVQKQAVVFQESFLFNTSVRENIRMGRMNATDAEIEDAARAADLHEMISTLPQSYETQVGERGGNLSGGIRQRLAIARALVRNPEILLLDEATSGLDVGTETAVNKMLEQARIGRTVITVNPRLAANVKCDRIFVLENGRVVEQGRHEDLLALGGTYTKLWQKQTGFVMNETGDQAVITAERLKAVPLLQGLDLKCLQKVASHFTTERLPAERVVVHEGDPADRFYIIVRGSVQVSAKLSRGEQDLALLEDGDHFGEIALLHDQPRNATVKTKQPTVLISLTRADFLSLVEEAPELGELINEHAKQRLRAVFATQSV